MEGLIITLGIVILVLWFLALVFFTVVYIVRGDDPEWEDR